MNILCLDSWICVFLMELEFDVWCCLRQRAGLPIPALSVPGSLCLQYVGWGEWRPGPAVTEDRGIEERGHPGEERRRDHNSPVHSRPATTRSLCGGSEEWSKTASIGRGGRKCLSREGGLMVGLIWMSPTVDWNCHFNNRWTLCENWMENECAV